MLTSYFKLREKGRGLRETIRIQTACNPMPNLDLKFLSFQNKTKSLKLIYVM